MDYYQEYENEYDEPVLYDDLDFYSVISHGDTEDDSINPDEEGFIRGYLGLV